MTTTPSAEALAAAKAYSHPYGKTGDRLNNLALAFDAFRATPASMEAIKNESDLVERIAEAQWLSIFKGGYSKVKCWADLVRLDPLTAETHRNAARGLLPLFHQACLESYQAAAMRPSNEVQRLREALRLIERGKAMGVPSDPVFEAFTPREVHEIARAALGGSND